MELVFLLIIPLLTALLVMLVREGKAVQLASAGGAVLQLATTLYLTVAYSRDPGSREGAMLFQKEWTFFPSLNISFHIGVDGISVAMILLTALVVLAGVLVSGVQRSLNKEYYVLLNLLAVSAYGFFLSLDAFIMFLFLELAVLPKYLLIVLWGSGKKEYSANKLVLMLMAASAMIWIGLLGIYYGLNGTERTFDLMRLSTINLSPETQRFFFPFLFLGFGVFTAIFPFHTWVPDGHSSAPTAGSMFLAGISMKLGGYGCLRVATWLMPEGARLFAPAIIVLATIAILYGAFATLMQRDLKYMNAYSSVSHCGFVLLGIGLLNRTAIDGAVFQMFSHGVMTALFFAVIGMIYERTHTRTIAEMGGLMKSMPFIMTILYISGLCSLGLPGLSGFVAEVTVFLGGWQQPDLFHRVATGIACLSIVVTAVYILRAVGQIAMGPTPAPFLKLNDATWPERLAAILLVAGILAAGIAPYWLNQLIDPSVAVIVSRLGLK